MRNRFYLLFSFLLPAVWMVSIAPVYGQLVQCGLSITGVDSKTVACTGADLTGKQAALSITDQGNTLSLKLRSNRIEKDVTFNVSYDNSQAPASWKIPFAVTNFNGRVRDDQITIEGTGQHITGNPFGNVVSYLRNISASGSPAAGTRKTDNAGNPMDVSHPPSATDRYGPILQGVVYNPWLGGREFIPWVFTLTGEHLPFVAGAAAVPPINLNEAVALNNSGQFVGDYRMGDPIDAPSHGFVTNGVFNIGCPTTATISSAVTIDVPSASDTFANGTNNLANIVGHYLTGNTAHGFLLRGGTFTTIDFPGATNTTPYGINDGGQIVGNYVDSSGNEHGFLLSGGTFITIDFPGAISTEALGINGLGQIVGRYGDSNTFHSYLRSGSTFTTFDPPDGTISGASGINDLGQIVGVYFDAAFAIHGFSLNQGNFTTIDFPGAIATGVRGINNLGQIAGIYDNGSGTLTGFTSALAEACDVNGDGKIDINDINLIFAARQMSACSINDPRDPDRDGIVTVNDARICTLKCTKPGCVP